MKERADKVLTERGLANSRSQAKSMIEKGDVLINGKALTKAGELIDSEAQIEVTTPNYVGRGAFKLIAALEKFPVSIKDKVMLDVGASTGGFTEILLLHQARKVYAIDVGHDQLVEKLKSDPRVVNMEGQNIRELTALPEVADGAVMDLSFISITKVLPQVRLLLKEGAFLIALIKPQFEAGLERLPKDGVIKDDQVRKDILQEVIQFSVAHGWLHHETILSPIEGKAGNIEFLSYFTRS